MAPFDWFACGLGLGSGLLAGWLVLHVSGRLAVESGFWRKFATTAMALVSPDSRDSFGGLYLQLWRAVLRYCGQKCLVGMLAFSPVTLAFFALDAVKSQVGGFSDRSVAAAQLGLEQGLSNGLGMGSAEMCFMVVAALASLSVSVLLRMLAWRSRRPTIS